MRPLDTCLVLSFSGTILGYYHNVIIGLLCQHCKASKGDFACGLAKMVSANVLTSEFSGIAASLGAAVVWSLSVSIYRIYGVGRSAIWLNLFKGLVGLFFFMVTVLILRSEVLPSWRAHLVLVISGVIGVLIGDSAFFAGLHRIGATITSAIQCLAPPLTGVLAWIFFGEELLASQVAGLVLTSACLAGLIFFESGNQRMARPAISHAFTTGVGLALAAACCQALGAIVARPVLSGLSPFVTAAARLWLPVLILTFIEMRRASGARAMIKGLLSGPGTLLLVVAGFLGTFLGLTLMMYGMAHAPLGVALALNSTYPVWIMLGERAFGRTTISRLGAIFVLGSVAGIWLMI
jgi:drug/metabolite transporter (DMT)-like permease